MQTNTRPRGWPDIPMVHAGIAPTATVLNERRMLYRLAVEMLGCDVASALTAEILDSPLTRNSVGDALAGRAGLVCSELTDTHAGVPGCRETGDLRVASGPEANTRLAAALHTIDAQLRRQQAASGVVRLLTEADGDRFGSALAVLVDGVSLARSVSPTLTDDLLAHVALVGIVDPQHAGRLASASSRKFPGLVLLESPRTGVEAAEALVHEGAHQKFFDLAITRDFLDAESDRYPPFHPPWAKRRAWPLEQTLAACHAYACLARFAADLTPDDGETGGSSLLPVASERRDIIGRWLLERRDRLGTDARTLLNGLLGRAPSSAGARAEGPTAPVSEYVVTTGLELRRGTSSDRVLVASPSRPPRLHWVSDDAAAVLETLRHRKFDEVVATFAHRWGAQRHDTTDRLQLILSQLAASDLVAPARRA